MYSPNGCNVISVNIIAVSKDLKAALMKKW